MSRVLNLRAGDGDGSCVKLGRALNKVVRTINVVFILSNMVAEDG